MYEEMDSLDEHYRRYYFACRYYIIYYSKKNCLDYDKETRR